MSIQTPARIFTPNRILQGSTDAGNHFQSVTSEVFVDQFDHLLQWLDEVLLNATEENNLINLLEKFFDHCRKFDFKLHTQKIEINRMSVHFCDRLIDGRHNSIRSPSHRRTANHATTKNRGGPAKRFMRGQQDANIISQLRADLRAIPSPPEQCYKESRRNPCKTLNQLHYGTTNTQSHLNISNKT